MLDVAWNLSLIPFAVNARDEITAPLIITGTRQLYEQHYDEVRINDVLHFITFEDNRSSIEGVNVDTELQKLLEIEQAYGANSQVLTSLSDMLDTLLASV